MQLNDLVNSYIDHKRSLGTRYESTSAVLHSFCRAMGDISAEAVGTEPVLAFIQGPGPITTRAGLKFYILRGLYRYAIARGFVSKSPLPARAPKVPPAMTPYIYSVEELERLLLATDILQTPRSPLQAASIRTMLLLLYGTGMRIGEALALTIDDVDLGEQLLTVRDSKFFKTRLIPIGPRLTGALVEYLSLRNQLPFPNDRASAFLATKTGVHWDYLVVNKLFCRLRNHAGIRRESTARYQPRLHDIRHTTAVHRVTAWYRRGENVQQLLPILATFLGHCDIASTQRYISMTPELLQQASHRFERYAEEVCRAQ